MLKQDHTTYKGYRGPGIRLTEPIAPSVNTHRSELVRSKLYAFHLFDKAHLVMLTEEGLIPRTDGIAMLRALRQMEVEGVEALRLGRIAISHVGRSVSVAAFARPCAQRGGGVLALTTVKGKKDSEEARPGGGKRRRSRRGSC